MKIFITVIFLMSGTTVFAQENADLDVTCSSYKKGGIGEWQELTTRILGFNDGGASLIEFADEGSVDCRTGLIRANLTTWYKGLVCDRRDKDGKFRGILMNAPIINVKKRGVKWTTENFLLVCH